MCTNHYATTAPIIDIDEFNQMYICDINQSVNVYKYTTRFGSKGLRMFRVLLADRQVEHKQVS